MTVKKVLSFPGLTGLYRRSNPWYPFKIITDHASLQWLIAFKDFNGWLASWNLCLQFFEFSIKLLVYDNANEFNSSEYATIVRWVEENIEWLPNVWVLKGRACKKQSGESKNGMSEEPRWKLWMPTKIIDRMITQLHMFPSTICCGRYNVSEPDIMSQVLMSYSQSIELISFAKG